MSLANLRRIAVSVLLLATPASAQSIWLSNGLSESTPIHNENTVCLNAEVDDPFAIPAQVFSPWKIHLPDPFGTPRDLGKCVDTKRFRSVVTLTPEGIKNYGLTEFTDHLIVGNVRHLEDYYVAAIPLHAAEDFVYQIEVRQMSVLGVRPGHGQMLVEFSEPVTLIPQTRVKKLTRAQVNELIFTVNAVGVDKPSRGDVIKNIDGSLLLAMGIHTVDARLWDGFIESETNTLPQFRVDMPQDAKAAYISAFVEDGNKHRLGRHFFLPKSNCNSNQFRIIDSVLSETYTRKQRWDIRWADRLDPKNALHALKVRGLADDTSAMDPFEQDPRAQTFFERWGVGPKD